MVKGPREDTGVGDEQDVHGTGLPAHGNKRPWGGRAEPDLNRQMRELEPVT
jgi:hypothetical protein